MLPDSRNALRSSGVPRELNSWMNSRLLGTKPWALVLLVPDVSPGGYLVSEVTRVVGRLDWPSGSRTGVDALLAANGWAHATAMRTRHTPARKSAGHKR